MDPGTWTAWTSNGGPAWWIVLLLGAVLGHLVTMFFKGLAVAPRVIGGLFESRPLEGTWHECHWSCVDGKAELRREKWVIRRGLNAEYFVKTTSILGPNYQFHGKMIREKGHWIVEFKGRKHSERVLCRIGDPLPTSSSPVLFGLQSMLDFNDRPCVGPLILSRNTEIDSDQAQVLMAGAISHAGEISLSVLTKLTLNQIPVQALPASAAKLTQVSATVPGA